MSAEAPLADQQLPVLHSEWVSGLRLSWWCPAAAVLQGARCAPASSAGTV